MLTFFWYGISTLVAKEHLKLTLVVYAALKFFTIVVMAHYKWDKKWMRIKTSVGSWAGVWLVASDLFILLVCVLSWITMTLVWNKVIGLSDGGRSMV